MGLSHLATYMVPPYKDLICMMSGRIIVAPLLTMLLASMIMNVMAVVVLYIFIHRAIVKAFRVNRSEGFFKQSLKVIFHKSSDKDKTDDDTNSSLKAREIRNTLLVLMVVICSAIAYLPGFIHVVLISINPKLFRVQDKLIIYIFLTINSVINPILYAFNIKNIREAGMKLFYRVILCVEMKQDGSTSVTMSTVA